MSSKLFDWVLRNISQNYSRNDRKAAIFGLFSIFSNIVLQFEGNFPKVSSPYSSPLCAMASISYGWDLRNVAKSFLNMTKKGQLWTFSILFKNCPNDSNEKLYSHFFIMSVSYMCDGIEIVRLAFEKHSQKYTKTVLVFFNFLKYRPCGSDERVYSLPTPYRGPLCAMASQSYSWDSRT